MRRIIQFILVLMLVFVVSGCEKQGTNNLQVYLDMLDVQDEVSYDFYVPRILNGENDHIITWKSSNEEVVKIGNIISITGLQYYMVEVNQDEQEHTITLTACIDMIDGSNGTKDFNILVLEDLLIKEEKLNYIKNIINKYNNITVKESIKLPVVTEKYGFEIIWKSNNEEIISSAGEYKSPESDITVIFDVVVLYNGLKFYEDKVTLFVINRNSVEKEILLDFVLNFGEFGQTWDSAYSERKVDNTALGVDLSVNVVFSRADKQSGTITDRPVVATKASTEYITVVLDEKTIKNIEFSLTQWTTKTFDSIYIEYFDGVSWVKCSSEITTPDKIYGEVSVADIQKIRLSFNSSTNKNVQMGIEYIKIEIN